MSSAATWRALRIAVPASFAIGFGIEVFMVKVPIGGQNFYDVAKRKEAERRAEAAADRAARKQQR